MIDLLNPSKKVLNKKSPSIEGLLLIGFPISCYSILEEQVFKRLIFLAMTLPELKNKLLGYKLRKAIRFKNNSGSWRTRLFLFF